MYMELCCDRYYTVTVVSVLSMAVYMCISHFLFEGGCYINAELMFTYVHMKCTMCDYTLEC